MLSHVLGAVYLDGGVEVARRLLSSAIFEEEVHIFLFFSFGYIHAL